MHIGRENPRFEYEMTDKQGITKVLKSVEIEKDLGVYVQENLKFEKHVSLTINRANKLHVVGLIKRTISYLDQETLLTLYKSIVTNSRAKPQKPRRWKSMLIHQGWFTALYIQHLSNSQGLEFEICIFPREAIPSHYHTTHHRLWKHNLVPCVEKGY